MTNVSMDEIINVVSLQLGARAVNEKSLIVEELGAESADVMNIVAVLEDRYGITIKETELGKIRTPADLFSLVYGKSSKS